MHDDPAIRSDPQAFIAAPVLAALNRIALAAVIGFGVVAGWATLPLLLPIGEEFHQAFHFGLPIAWTLFAATVAASLLLHPAPVEPDVWVRAMQVDAGQAHRLCGAAERLERNAGERPAGDRLSEPARGDCRSRARVRQKRRAERARRDGEHVAAADQKRTPLSQA